MFEAIGPAEVRAPSASASRGYELIRRRFRPHLSLNPTGGRANGAEILMVSAPAGEQPEAYVKGNPQIIDLLNEVLTNELTSVNQYYLHARICENWGYERLWKKIRAESIDEMKHADQLIERILYLEGLPNLQKLDKINVGESVAEQLRLDLEVEKNAIQMLNRGIELGRKLGDNGSADLLEDMLEDEEEHANWLEAQLSMIAQMGVEHYLAQQVKHDE